MLAPMRPKPIMPIRIRSPARPVGLSTDERVYDVTMTIRGQITPGNRSGARKRKPACFSLPKTTLFGGVPQATALAALALAESAARRLSANELIRHALDLRPKLRELLLDRLVAAIDVINPLDVSLPLGHEAG